MTNVKLRLWAVITISVIILSINIVHIYNSKWTMGWSKRVGETAYGASVVDRYGHFLAMREYAPDLTLYMSINDEKPTFRQRFYGIVGQDASIKLSNYNPQTFLLDIYPEEPKDNILYSRRSSSAFEDQDRLRTSMIVGVDKNIEEVVFIERGLYDIFVDARLLTVEQLGELH